MSPDERETAPCAECGAVISVELDYCRECGYEPGSLNRLTYAMKILSIIAIVAIPIPVVLFWLLLLYLEVMTPGEMGGGILELVAYSAAYCLLILIPGGILYKIRQQESQTPTQEI